MTNLSARVSVYVCTHCSPYISSLVLPGREHGGGNAQDQDRKDARLDLHLETLQWTLYLLDGNERVFFKRITLIPVCSPNLFFYPNICGSLNPHPLKNASQEIGCGFFLAIFPRPLKRQLNIHQSR